jgi:hypothetical protein
VPGAYVARPVYAPALVGWVGGGPSVNVNIHVGSGPVVGWVPLAPREVYRPWYPLPRDHWRYVNPHAPDRIYRPGLPPRGPVTFANRGAPGGVTVVPADTLRQRQPIANVVNRVDPRLAQQLVQQPATQVAPPPPPAVVSARPAPAVPRAPNAGPAGAQAQAPNATPAAPRVPSPPNAVPPGRAAQPGDGQVQEGRRGHGYTPPQAREAQREAGPRGQATRAVETPRPPVPPSPPEARRAGPPGAVREAPPHPAGGQPVPPHPAGAQAMPPPAMRSVPAREAEARPAPNLPTAMPRAQPPEPRGGGREVRGEGRGEGRWEGRGEGRPGGPRQQAQ